eukprot:COSAG05_NODE_15390_length_371_cov_0.569853_1_plen_28_part_10
MSLLVTYGTALIMCLSLLLTPTTAVADV